MKTIYKKAKQLGIEIKKFEKRRYDLTEKNHILPIGEVEKLCKNKMEKYLNALWCIHSENAGGYDGWTVAHNIFEELGFVKKETRSGHRIFVNYVF